MFIFKWMSRSQTFSAIQNGRNLHSWSRRGWQGRSWAGLRLERFQGVSLPCLDNLPAKLDLASSVLLSETVHLTPALPP